MAVTAKQPVKVSLQSQRAGDTAKHNDRTMYKQGYFNELAPDDGIPNFHWTKEKFGVHSDEMERDMYEALFLDKLRERNKIHASNYQWDKVIDLDDVEEREEALNDFRWKHPPRETIFQVGSMDNPIDREHAKKILMAQGEKMVEMQSDNFIVLSYDVHMDEGSPHMHMRFLMLDEKGMPNTEGALKEMGVEPPLSYEEWAERENKKRKEKAERNPNYRYRLAEAKPSARNNRLVRFTRDMREDFELMVENEGISIDTTRTRRKHVTQAQERTRREVASEQKEQEQKLEKMRKEQEQKRLDAAARLAAEKRLTDEEIKRLEDEAAKEREERDKKIKAKAEELRQQVEQGDKELKKKLHYNELKRRNQELLKKLYERDPDEMGPFYDNQGQKMDEQWFIDSYASVEAAPFSDSKKAKIKQILNELEDAVKAPEQQRVNTDTLAKLQSNSNKAQRVRKEAVELQKKRESQARRDEVFGNESQQTHTGDRGNGNGNRGNGNGNGKQLGD